MKRKRQNAGSRVRKRSISIGGHKTSIGLEDEFWRSLKEMALSRNLSLPKLVARIDSDREHANLSSHLRLFVLDHYRRLAEEATSVRKAKR